MTIQSALAALPVNWKLLGNPVNWIIVVLMIAIAGAAVAVIFNATSGASQDDTNGNP